MADDLKLQLVTLTKNLNTLREREAKYGGNTPLELLNLIDDHLTAIALFEQCFDDSITYMLERASQVILVTPPEPAAWTELEDLMADLKDRVQKKTSLFTVINRVKP